MITLIEGIASASNLGSGKTLLMIRYLVNDFFKNKRIFCNIRINKINYEQIFIEDFLDESKTDMFKNATIGIDEITLFMDCRRSMQNTFLSYIFLQSRKRKLNFYVTTQSLDMLDNRLLPYIGIHVITEMIFDIDNKPIKHLRKVTIIDRRNVYNPILSSFVFDISKWFSYYDTDEIVKPIYRIK